MPVYYRETAVDRPPNFDPRGTVPHQTQQQSLLQPQLSAGSSITGTTIVSPSESTCIFGVNDPRGTQSEGDGSEFGTWLSASHLGTPQMAKVPPSQSQFVASQQRMPSVAKQNGQPQSQMLHFPMEVRVQQSGDAQQSQEAGEVSRRSERWSREEFYPPAGSERMPGAPFHKVTKENYVIEQVVESSPKLVTTTRIVYPPAQQQPLGAQPQTQQIPRQQQNQPKGQWQAKPEQQQQQQQRKIQPQQDGQAQQQQQRQPPPQVPFKTQHQKMAQPTQPPQRQEQYAVQQQPQQHEQYPMQQQPKQQQQAQQYSIQPQLQQPVQQVQKPQNFAKQHQYVHQQVQFQQPQPQQQYEHPQHATEREQHQQAQQYVMKQQQQTQQKQPQRVQIVGQMQLGQIEQQQQRGGGGQQPEQQQKQAVVGQQQQQKENGQAKQQPKQGQFGQEEEQAVQQAKEQQKWNKQQQNEQPYQIHVQKQQQQQQQQQLMWEQQQKIEGDEIGEKVKQKQRTMPQMGEAEESAEDDEPPPQMQLAEAPEELIQRQKSVGEGDGSVSPERQKHRKHVMVNSPWYRQNAEFEQKKYQDFRNYAEPLYVCPDFPADGSVCQFDDSQQKSPEHKYYYQHFQPQQRVHQYFSPSSVKWDSVYEDEFPDGQPPPFAHGPGSPYEYLLYHQKVNLDRRRAESEQRRRHHSPVPGAAEHGYKFGGMDFVDHIEFNPCSDVGEPFDERQSRRDLHTGPPRRRGDFYGLDYTTMLPDGQWRQPNEWEAEDAQNYHGYQALPPRKNFRLCGRYTADPDAPLNIAEADGLDELNSDYLVGNTLANQRCVTDRELTDEEKRTFALLYGPSGFKPDHVTIRPDPLPEEPPVFSTTIGPQKSRSAADISPTPQGYVNPMKVEGESWMLGRRSEQGNYGLASSGEQPPFVRPARFPPHVPQWAKDRQFSMTRGAKSVDRSLFAPSWAKVPQPQPPYWVKRTEDGKGVGAVQKGKAWEEEEEKEKHDEMGKGQRVGAVQTQQQQQQRQPTQQQMEQQMVKLQQNQLKQSQQTQGQTEQLMPKQNQMQQQFRAVQQQKAQQPPQQFEYEKGIMQKTTVVTTVEITEEPQEDYQPQEEQQRVGAVQQKNEQRQWPINRQQQQVKQQQRPQQQQIATTKTNATATAENIANGTPKDGQTQQWRQQQQQPTRQVQAVQQQIEKMPVQQRAFDKPGGMYYFHEKRTEDKSGEKEGEKQTEQRIVTKQQQKVPSAEASSGLENLKMPKLGEFPALPEAGKRFTGPTEQQMVRHRNAPPQQQQPKEGQTVRQQMPKFPTGRRWSKEPQEGDVFVDGFGRPVHYVREMVVDPRTGEAVTREEWRLANERRTEEEEGEGQNVDSLPANSSRHFRQQIITKSTQNSVKQ